MLVLSIALPIILIVLMVVGMVVIIEKHEKQVIEEAPRNVILPSSITKAEDFVWFETVMKMAGLEHVEVLNTCDCGFAAECYMHCNHDLSDKCTGHAYTPWTGKFKAVQTPDLISVNDRRANDMRAIATQHRERTLPDSKIDAFRQNMIANRNAKLRAEFEATKKREAPSERMEAMRKRMDERHIKISELKNLTRYNPRDDTFSLANGRKISRFMLEELVDCGRLEEVMEFGSDKPVKYYGIPVFEDPPDTSWIKMERV